MSRPWSNDRYARGWVGVTVLERWEAFLEFRACHPGATLAEFMALGPYVRCSWLKPERSTETRRRVVTRNAEGMVLR